MNNVARVFSTSALAFLLPLAGACGGGVPHPADGPAPTAVSSAPAEGLAPPGVASNPGAPATPSVAAPSAPPKPVASPSPASAQRPSTSTTPTPPPAPPKRERIALHNSCSKPMRLYFKRPGADLQTSINTSTSTEEHATDGDIIQLMDDTGRNELDRVTITPSMKLVDIQSNCRKFEAK